MAHTFATAGRIGVAIVALIVGGLLLLIATLGIIPRVLGSFAQNWTGHAGIFTPRMPFIENWAEIGKDYSDAYNGFIFSSTAPLVESRWLSAAEGALDSLVIIAGSLLIVLIAIRVLMVRSFSRVARWGLVALGLLIMLDATLGPQLAPLASDIALQQLGYPILGPNHGGFMTENSPEWAIPALWDPIWVVNRFDFSALMLGVVVILFGFLIHDGVRLQKETEGLV